MVSYVLQILTRGYFESRKGPVGVFDKLTQSYRAWPRYCDQNLHVNNAHYLTFMDYGRVIWFVRSGVWDRVRSDDYRALVAGLGITYRREIRWFTKFQLETQVVGVEGRWIYLVQEFVQNGKVAARATLRVGISGPDGLVDAQEWLGAEDAVLPDDVRAWAIAGDAAASAISAGNVS